LLRQLTITPVAGRIRLWSLSRLGWTKSTLLCSETYLKTEPG